jgi:hypothetical protein
MAELVIPGAADRTVIIGPTGSGKTILGAWILSLQRFDLRPWVALDFKDEELWDRVGDPPMRHLALGRMPGKTGLYRMHVHPGDEDEIEAWMWKVWAKGNIGIFVDEVSLVPQKKAFKALLRQGRSKRIPIIACTQRPVDCDREVFSEAQYSAFFGLRDARDYQVIRGLFGDRDIRDAARGLSRHWSLWYDAKRDELIRLRPCPDPATVAVDLRKKVPYNFFLGA